MAEVGVEYQVEKYHQQTLATCWYAAFIVMIRWHKRFGILKKLQHKWGPFYDRLVEANKVPGAKIDTDESAEYVRANHGKALSRSALKKLVELYRLKTSVISKTDPMVLLHTLVRKKPLVYLSGRSEAQARREQTGPTLGHCVVISGILIRGGKATVGYMDPLGAELRTLSFEGFMKKFPPFWESGSGIVVVHL